MSPHAGSPAHRFHRRGLSVCRELQGAFYSASLPLAGCSAKEHSHSMLSPDNLQGYPHQCFTRFKKGIII